MRTFILNCSLLLILSSLILSCESSPKYIKFGGYAQGGNYSIKANIQKVRLSPKEIQDGVDSILLLIDNSLSGYNKGSLISRFNQGEQISSNGILDDIFSRSRRYYEQSGGALDVASAPLFDAWGFGFTRDSLPAAALIDSLLQHSGMKSMPQTVESAAGKGFKLNFNAIAQGYSCDLVAQWLDSIGVKDMLVDIGEIYCRGLNPSGRPWTIAVDSPIDGNQQPGAHTEGIWQSDGGSCGVVTSGNYRKFYIRDGKKYAHTIDPRSGYPVEHNLLSATIIAPNATDADAYATYCMVIGLDEAVKFVNSRKDIEAFFIYDEEGQNKSWKSEGFNLISPKQP